MQMDYRCLADESDDSDDSNGIGSNDKSNIMSLIDPALLPYSPDQEMTYSSYSSSVLPSESASQLATSSITSKALVWPWQYF